MCCSALWIRWLRWRKTITRSCYSMYWTRLTQTRARYPFRGRIGNFWYYRQSAEYRCNGKAASTLCLVTYRGWSRHVCNLCCNVSPFQVVFLCFTVSDWKLARAAMWQLFHGLTLAPNNISHGGSWARNSKNWSRRFLSSWFGGGGGRGVFV